MRDNNAGLLKEPMKKLLDSKILLKSFPLIFVTAFLLLLTVPNPLLVKEQAETKPQTVTEVENKTNTNQIDMSSGENSVKVEVDNKVQASTDNNNNNQTTPTQGTCTVTINGVTTVVPADQVKIDESGPEDQNVQVNCHNEVNSSTNKSSTKTKVDINVNSSP
jgi:hypothetical protein